MTAIFIVGTSHQAYQTRPRCGPQDGADAFKGHILQMVQTHSCKTIAEEMSIDASGGCRTVCFEVAKEENLSHILCDPTCSERQALGISKDNTPLDIAKRENEWLRRLVHSGSGIYPVLFLCGAGHVCSFAQLCRQQGLEPTIVTRNFEAPEIPLERRII
jgi:hypothetical protein